MVGDWEGGDWWWGVKVGAGVEVGMRVGVAVGVDVGPEVGGGCGAGGGGLVCRATGISFSVVGDFSVAGVLDHAENISR